ncbi:MAG: hypothetical protein AABZ01_05350 [Gemmatimonadota bacterium]|mgnify:CR=1 FL=1
MTATLRQLLHGAIDYAGLFPPAALSLEAAARAYAEYRIGPDVWALGRFMLTARHLQPLAGLLPELEATPPWPLGLTLGSHPQDDLELAAAFHHGAGAPFARVTGVEGRAGTPDEIRALLAAVPPEWDRFVELPLDQDLAPFITILVEHRAGAKFRTGGVTPEGFPASEALLSGLAAVARAGIPFKCTAGLHHPVRGRYPLSYLPDGPSGMMYGYLNVFVTAALLAAGHPIAKVRPVLLEEDPAAFRADQEVLGWRDLLLDRNQLAEFRRGGLQGFGSCSFQEPVDDLLTVFHGSNAH